MKKLLIFLLFLSCLNTNAQTLQEKQKINKENNNNKLLTITQKYKSKYSKTELQSIAKENKWEYYIERDNSFSELVDITMDNKPIYYITYNKGAGITSRAYTLYSGGNLGLSIHGENMTSGIWDAGYALPTHEIFSGRITVMDGASSSHYHATHVAGTIIGTDQVQEGIAKGMAFMANGNSYDWSNDLSEVATAANNGLLLSNHSYGYNPAYLDISQWGKYDLNSQGFDDIMFNAPYYQFVCAAGNSRNDGVNTSKNGYDLITGHALSKNGISVAAVNEIMNYAGPSSVTLSDFSSWGPTDDGRIKPDISAKGVGTFSALDNNDTSYGELSGTSMASPSVTGTLLLLQQYYNELNNEFMRAATLRALMIHSADEAGDSPGPDYKFGWGLINAEAAANVITDRDLFSVIEQNTLHNNDTYTRNYNALGTEPLLVTLCWTDPAGNIPSNAIDDNTPILVNDLDVRVFENGTEIFPWKLDVANPSAPATNGDNLVDNVEKIQINNPSGNYQIVVSHKGNLQGGQQNYSLIVSGVASNEFWFEVQDLTDFEICSSAGTSTIGFNFFRALNAGSEEVTFSLEGAPSELISLFTPKIVSNETTFSLELSGISSLSPGQYDATIRGQSTSFTYELPVTFLIVEAINEPQSLIFPSDNQTSLEIPLEFEWQNLDHTTSYQIQIATDLSFNNIIEDVTTSLSQYVSQLLESGNQYYWRVKPINNCGEGDFSSVYSFTVGCVRPTDISVANILSESAEISWSQSGGLTTWDIEYGPFGFVLGSGTVTQVNNTQYTLTGLAANTQYDIYIRSICDDPNTSIWVGPISFSTLNDFCSGNNLFYDSGGSSGEYSNNENNTTIIYPTGGFNSVTVQFSSFNIEEGYDFLSIYDGSDTNSPLIGMYTGTDIGSGLFTATNPEGALTFLFTSDEFVTASGWQASVTCEYFTCKVPFNPTLNNISQTSADINWGVIDAETQWQVEYGTKGFTQGNGTLESLTTNSFTLTNLNVLTSYDVYIRANCGATPGDDDSNWVGPISFTTLDFYAPINLTAELYDHANGIVELTWGKPINFVGEWIINLSYFCNNINDVTAPIIFYSDFTFEAPNEGSYGTWSASGNQITFTFDDGLGYTGTIEGDYMSGTNDYGMCWYANRSLSQNDTNSMEFTVPKVLISGELASNPGEVYTYTFPQNNSVNALQGYNIYRENSLITTTTDTTYLDNLPTYGNYDYHITAVYDDGESQPSNIESFEWTICPESTSFAVSNISASTADLSWNIENIETKWQLEYGITGFTQGSGTIEQLATNFFTLTNLSVLTTYDVYIRTNCGANPGDQDSNWIGPISFTTIDFYSPSNLTAQLTDNANGIVELNWGKPNSVIGEWIMNLSLFCNNTSDFSLAIIFYSDFTFVMPVDGSSGTWNVNGDQVSFTDGSGLEFYGTIKGDYMSGTSSTGICWDANRKSSTNETNSMDYNVSTNNSSKNNVINALQGYNVYRDNSLINSTTSTTYRDTLPTSGNYDYHITAVYDGSESQPSNTLSVQWTSCPEPTGFVTSGISASTVNLSWIKGSAENQWEIEYGVTGFTQGNGTIEQASTPSHILRDLNSLTTYDVYLRANCSAVPDDDDSIWIGPLTFTTLIDYCDGNLFYDSGGPGGDYANSEHTITTIYPTVGFNSVTVEFNSFQTEICCDYMNIYDGEDTNASFLGQFRGTSSPGSLTSTHPSGALTFLFVSDGSVTSSGWEASVTCQFISCREPVNPNLLNVNHTTAEINWSAVGAETQWEIEYGVTGFTQGSGTIEQANTTSHNLIGLTPVTSYDVYIRSNCGANPGDDDSNWIGPLSFTTACDTFFTAPLYEHFDTDKTPNCWEEYGDESWQFSLGADYDAADADDHTQGLNSYYAWIDGSGPFGAEHISHLRTMQIDVSQLSNPTLQFSVFSVNNNDYAYNTLRVSVSNGINESSNVLTLQGHTNNDWLTYTIDLAGMTTNSELIRVNFSIEENSPGSPFYNDILIDDIIIDEANALGVENFDNSTFSYYPNPVDNVLKINYSKKIDKVEVYNMLGQKLKSVDSSESNIEIDMSELNTGYYILNVYSGLTKKVIKVVKI